MSVNKPMKDEMKKGFLVWYAWEVQKQLKEDIPLDHVKVDLTGTATKAKSASWIISSWQTLLERPIVAVNGFRKSGILDAITSVTTNWTLQLF